MMRLKDLFENEKILNGFKNTTVRELEVAGNRFITDNLEIGKTINLSVLHDTVRENINNGIVNLLWEKEIDYAIVREFLKVGLWNISIYFDYESISVWEDIGKYNLKWEKRKNASISNDNVKLVKAPYFEIGTESLKIENKDISLYDLICNLIEIKRKLLIDKYNEEIIEYMNRIEDVNIQLDEVKNLEIKF